MRVIVSRALPVIKHAIRIPAHPVVRWLSHVSPIIPYVELSPEEVTHCVRIGNEYHVSPDAYKQLQVQTEER